MVFMKFDVRAIYDLSVIGLSNRCIFLLSTMTKLQDKNAHLGMWIFFWTYDAIPCDCLYCSGLKPPKDTLLWSSFFVTLVAKKYRLATMLPFVPRMVCDSR